MQIRLAIFAVCSLALLGCTPPNTPEPPPPPPVAPVSQPVQPTSTPPVTDPTVAETPANPVLPATPPVEPEPPKAAVNVGEQIDKLTNEKDRQAAAVALASVGKSAVPALTKALDHADWQVRAAAVFALGQIGKDASDTKARLQAIAEKDDNSSVRDAAAFALDALEGK